MPITPQAREAMLKATHTKWAPWTLVDFNDQKRGRLTLVRDLLDRLPQTTGLPTTSSTGRRSGMRRWRRALAGSSRSPTSRSSATESGRLGRSRSRRQPRVRDWAAPRGRRQFATSMVRPLVLAAILAALWPTLDPALVEPPAFLSAAPERVAQRFTRCGPGRGNACVIDGDTFKLGKRKIRIVGIDAPETHPANCPEEAKVGAAATAELMRLLNQGPSP